MAVPPVRTPELFFFLSFSFFFPTDISGHTVSSELASAPRLLAAIGYRAQFRFGRLWRFRRAAVVPRRTRVRLISEQGRRKFATNQGNFAHLRKPENEVVRGLM